MKLGLQKQIAKKWANWEMNGVENPNIDYIERMKGDSRRDLLVHIENEAKDIFDDVEDGRGIQGVCAALKLGEFHFWIWTSSIKELN